MEHEICGILASHRVAFDEDLTLTACVLPERHNGPHLYYSEEMGEYKAWEPVDVASNFKDLCDQCPWSSNMDEREGDYCECEYLYTFTKAEFEAFLLAGQVSK